MAPHSSSRPSSKPAGRTRTWVAVAASLAVSGVVGTASLSAAPARAAAADPRQLTITGSGFGHGVGMSQYGALGMARSGATVSQIMKHYFTGVEVAPYPDRVDVRVNVAHAATRMTLGSTALATGGGGLTLIPAGGSPLVLAAQDTAVATPSGGRIKVVVNRASGTSSTASAAEWQIRWPGTRLIPGAAGKADVTSTRSGSSTPKTRSYRWGSLVLTAAAGLLEAVVVVDLHSEYLRGVAEMPSSWPDAALQAQAVAARNYVLDAVGRAPRASCGGCHLWDDTRSQVYAGWAKESERIGPVRYGDRWVAAVTATQTSPTSGLTVLHRGRPVATYFASSTGGRTRDPADVWGSALPYLTSVADPWSVDPSVNPGYARWTRTVPVARALSLFDLPDLVSITVTSRDSAAAARTVTAISSSGSRRSVGGNTFAQSFGLPGAWISEITLPGSKAPAANPPTGSAAGGDPSSSSVVPPDSVVPKGLTPVYWLPGVRSSGGRTWSTRCERYSSTAYRCFAYLWGTTYRQVGRTWVAGPGWVLNNLVYLDSGSGAWSGNPLATPGSHTLGGRQWRTECSSATGARSCSTWLLTTRVHRMLVDGRYRPTPTPTWMLNARLYLG